MIEKIEYTDEELKEQGWATVGGRVEDFIEIASKLGLLVVADEIENQYGENADDVYRGMLVCMRHGPEAYYNGF